MFPWGALISGGASILSGLLGSGGSSAEGGGSKKAKHNQLDYDRRRIKALVDGAKDAGIHPLVALGAGGGGFSAAGNVDSGFGFGDAVSRGLDALGDYYEQDQDRAERAEQRAYDRSQDDDAKFQRILDDQARIKSEDQAVKESNARIAEHMANARAANARAMAIGAAPGVRTLVGPGGLEISPAPGRNSASDWEQEYGEAGDLVGGVGGMVEDGVLWLQKNVPGPKFDSPWKGQKPWFDLKSYGKQKGWW